MRIVSLLFFILSFTTARGDDSAAQRLLNLHHRPTVTEILAALKPWPESNPFSGNSAWNKNTENLVANAIVQAEFAYPGLTYAPMGRDLVQLGDYIDAFYTLNGDTGRVRRINGSGGSIKIADDMLLRKLLTSAGLNLTNLENEPPFVLIDNTSYPSRSSQMGYLLYAAYDEAYRMGFSKKLLYRKLTGLSLSNNNITKGTNLEREFQQAIADSGDKKVPPPSIFSLSAATSDGLSYTTAWHNSFGTIREVRPGVWEAPPGDLMSLSDRESILATMYEGINTIRKPGFLKKVQEKAKEYGYIFAFRSQSSTLSVPIDFEYELQLNVANVIAAMSAGERPKTRRTDLYSSNGTILRAWLTEHLVQANYAKEPVKARNLVNEEFLKIIDQSLDQGTIDERDAKHLLARFLLIANLSDAKLAANIRNLNIKSVKQLIMKDTAFFVAGDPHLYSHKIAEKFVRLHILLTNARPVVTTSDDSSNPRFSDDIFQVFVAQPQDDYKDLPGIEAASETHSAMEIEAPLDPVQFEKTIANFNALIKTLTPSPQHASIKKDAVQDQAAAAKTANGTKKENIEELFSNNGNEFRQAIKKLTDLSTKNTALSLLIAHRVLVTYRAGLLTPRDLRHLLTFSLTLFNTQSVQGTRAYYSLYQDYAELRAVLAERREFFSDTERKHGPEVSAAYTHLMAAFTNPRGLTSCIVALKARAQ